jgi:putative transposase
MFVRSANFIFIMPLLLWLKGGASITDLSCRAELKCCTKFAGANGDQPAFRSVELLGGCPRRRRTGSAGAGLREVWRLRRCVTDQLRKYPTAKDDIPELAGVKHVFVKAAARVNNRAENSHQPTRERERRMRGFRDRQRTQTFLSSFGPIRQHFTLKRHLLRASLYRKQLAARFATWREFAEVTPNPSAA